MKFFYAFIFSLAAAFVDAEFDIQPTSTKAAATTSPVIGVTSTPTTAASPMATSISLAATASVTHVSATKGQLTSAIPASSSYSSIKSLASSPTPISNRPTPASNNTKVASTTFITITTTPNNYYPTPTVAATLAYETPAPDSGYSQYPTNMVPPPTSSVSPDVMPAYDAQAVPQGSYPTMQQPAANNTPAQRTVCAKKRRRVRRQRI